MLRAISPFPTVFFTLLESFMLFSLNIKLLSSNCFSLGRVYNLSFGKELIIFLPWNSLDVPLLPLPDNNDLTTNPFFYRQLIDDFSL